MSARFRHRQQSYFKCCCITAALFLILNIVALIFLFTAFHAKDPIIRMNRVQIPQFAQMVSNRMALSSANITAIPNISVKNPNAASFRYGNSTIAIYYGREVISEGRIPVGKVAVRQTQSMNVTLEVVPARIATAPRLVVTWPPGISLLR